MLTVIVTLFLKKMVNVIHIYFYMNVCMKYKLLEYDSIDISRRK